MVKTTGTQQIFKNINLKGFIFENLNLQKFPTVYSIYFISVTNMAKPMSHEIHTSAEACDLTNSYPIHKSLKNSRKHLIKLCIEIRKMPAV